jgi:hypothetical protein
MRSLVVFEFRNKKYILVLGGLEKFTRENAFITGEEKELFEIEVPDGTPFMEGVRKVIAEADKRGITDILRFEEVFGNAPVNRPLKPGTQH